MLYAILCGRRSLKKSNRLLKFLELEKTYQINLTLSRHLRRKLAESFRSAVDFPKRFGQDIWISKIVKLESKTENSFLQYLSI